MSFGKCLAQLRKAHGLTQEELGKKLGVAASSVSSYEHDYREPDFNTLIHIADYFNVSIDHLLGRKDSRRPDDSLIHEFRGSTTLEQKMMLELRDVIRRNKKGESA